MARILFFYATNYCGHQKAAEAIQKSLHRLEPQTKTIGIDFFTYHYPNIGPFLSKLYFGAIRYMPHKAWDQLYDNPDVASFTVELRQFFSLINVPKLHEDIKQFRPDLIVCTQAVPAGFIAEEKRRGKLSLPHFATITDFVANPYWPNQYVDKYFVADREVKRSLMKRSIPEERIRVTGIPIDEIYGHQGQKSVACKKLGFDSSIPTILLMGGSLGIGRIPEAIRALLAMKQRLQLIAVTGFNKSLYSKLKEKYYDSPNVLILHHSRGISRLMDAATLLISKPGGLTSSEALVKGLPMIILSPLPGQEERNASYLLRHGVAERCTSLAKLPAMVEEFLDSPEKIHHYATQALGLAKPYASREIANHILSFLYNKNMI